MKHFLILMLSFIPFVLGAQTNKLSRSENEMAKMGMINMATFDPSLHIRLMYARTDNFVGHILYTDLNKAFLHPQAAKALQKAQKELKRLHPNLSLCIFDAARPMHVQQTMWNAVKNTNKAIYVSNPAHGGGLHNYGLAVDISICNNKGDTICMGTRVDYMGKAAHIDNESRLSKTAQHNRALLRKVMRFAGFMPLRTEWWHFNYKTRAVAKKYYKVIP